MATRNKGCKQAPHASELRDAEDRGMLSCELQKSENTQQRSELLSQKNSEGNEQEHKDKFNTQKQQRISEEVGNSQTESSVKAWLSDSGKHISVSSKRTTDQN